MEETMSERARIACPRCGAPMNRHAEKVDYSQPPPAGDSFQSGLGGTVTEFHTCPVCRFVEQRPADSPRIPSR
jgi:hypothetical protein